MSAMQYTLLASAETRMEFCEQCGSTSRDEQGFCRGCGARPASDEAAESSNSPSSTTTATHASLPQTESKATIGSIPLAEAHVKNVWVAVLLALFLGPLGMVYCTVPGALVMFAVSVIALLLPGKIVTFLLITAICPIWAGMAARSANSIY
jgi:membrane protein YqaA with SNARE-associated domain